MVDNEKRRTNIYIYIIGRPGGVLLSVHVLTALWIFGSRYNFLVCDLDLAAKYFTCFSLMYPSSFKQQIIELNLLQFLGQIALSNF